MKSTNEWGNFDVGKKFIKSYSCQKKNYRERFIIPFSFLVTLICRLVVVIFIILINWLKWIYKHNVDFIFVFVVVSVLVSLQTPKLLWPLDNHACKQEVKMIDTFEPPLFCNHTFCLPSRSTWVQPRFLVGFVLLDL